MVAGGTGAAISDPGLNYNDTWVSASEVVADTTTINTSEPFTDPTTDRRKGIQTFHPRISTPCTMDLHTWVKPNIPESAQRLR